jgi:hypothetical protein
MQQAIDSLPPLLPSQERTANSVGEEAPVPALPVVYSSQYSLDGGVQVALLQNGPLSGNNKVGEWLSNVETASLHPSDGPAVVSPLNCTPNCLNGQTKPNTTARINTSQTLKLSLNRRIAGSACLRP